MVSCVYGVLMEMPDEFVLIEVFGTGTFILGNGTLPVQPALLPDMRSHPEVALPVPVPVIRVAGKGEWTTGGTSSAAATGVKASTAIVDTAANKRLILVFSFGICIPFYF